MRTQGLPRRRRVRASADFTRGFAEGQRLGARFFRLHWRAAEGDARLGLAVSRKVDSRAVERNRIKRIVRDSFRCCAASLPPGDALMVAKREARGAAAADLRRDLESLWRRLAALPQSHAAGTMRRLAEPADARPDATPSPSSSADGRPSSDAARLPPE
jgi:ribonuclease P protein component